MFTDEQTKTAIENTTAPRVTEDYIRSRIADTRFERFSDTVTIAQITLDNGYSVRGESAVVNPQNYIQDVGERIAYDNAFAKLWPVFGFWLAEVQYRETNNLPFTYEWPVAA